LHRQAAIVGRDAGGECQQCLRECAGVDYAVGVEAVPIALEDDVAVTHDDQCLQPIGGRVAGRVLKRRRVEMLLQRRHPRHSTGVAAFDRDARTGPLPAGNAGSQPQRRDQHETRNADERGAGFHGRTLALPVRRCRTGPQ
jgi:hypothetical protein